MQRQAKLRQQFLKTVQALATMTLVTGAPLAAITVPDRPAEVLDKAFRHPDLHVPEIYRRADHPSAGKAMAGALATLGSTPDRAFVDPRSGRWGTLLLNRPLIPGGGNHLRWDDSKSAPPATPHLLKAAVWKAFAAFLDEHRAELAIAPGELDHRPRITIHDGGDLIQIHAPRTVAGLPVRSSWLTAVVNHGNLVLFGSRHWADVETSPTPTIGREVAQAIVRSHLAPLALAGNWSEPGLAFVPAAAGDGLGYRLAWVLRPALADDFGRWEALVDAHSGELLEFADRNRYASPRTVIGGVFPASNDGNVPDGIEQPGWPMPFADLQTAGGACGNGICELVDGEDCLSCAADCNGFQGGKPASRFCCGAGGGENPVGCGDSRCTSDGFQCSETATGALFTNSGGRLAECIDGTVTTQLAGRFARINDTCGVISESTAGAVLDLGTSPGTDCNVAPGASPGNTRAARTAYYEVNRIKEQARGQLPANTWLDAQLEAITNTQLSCGGFWNGSALSMSRSGSGCANLAEIAGVVDHEWGHGMDQNDATGSISSPAEGIADVYAALRLDLSCIGRGAIPGRLCTGYGDPCTSCDGVRDLDWARRTSMAPHDVAWIDVQCGSGSATPCGGTDHCEAAVYSESIWDLYNRDLPCLGTGWENVGGGQCAGGVPATFDKNTALEITTRLTYLGAGAVGGWFQCAQPFGGCASGGGYLNFLAADDDNGNLDDGTPHMSAIFAAFDRHGIACDTPAVVDSGCAGGPTAAPAVSAAPHDGGAELAWNAVAGALTYKVFRTEGVHACDFGKQLVGETAATTFTDSGLLNGREYYYVVLPVGPGGPCLGPASACTPVTPVAGPSDCPTCGNGAIESGEVCDGGDLGGATCLTQGCTGGALACLADCSGFDLSSCTGCGGSCGNGVCEAGEDCTTCGDCAGETGGKPANRFCCGNGVAEAPEGDGTICDGNF